MDSNYTGDYENLDFFENKNKAEENKHTPLTIFKLSGQYAVLYSRIRRNRKQMYEKELNNLFLSTNILSRL
jgi:hypothetical protein